MYVTNPHFRTSMNFQTFRRKKARGTTRIFVVGSSAAKGWPGDQESAFTGFLRRALDSLYPGRFEIINAAGHSYASHRVLDVMYDIVEHEPDFILVYSGNNEYVERNVLPASARNRHAMKINRVLRGSSLYRAVRLTLYSVSPSLFRAPEGPDLTDLRAAPVRRVQPARDPAIDREVRENYRKNVSEMARLLRRHAVAGAFCTVPVNRSAWVPASVPPSFGNPVDARKWDDAIRAAFDAYRGKRYAQAAAYFHAVAEITPGHPAARFFRGDALRRLGRYDEAREDLSAACEYDARPIRELPSFGRIVAEESARHGIPLIDLAAEFEMRSGKNLVGLDLFIDYCHPNEAGHKRIAETAFRGMFPLPGFRGVDGSAVSKRIREDASAVSRYSSPSMLYAQGMTHQNNGDLAGAERLYRESLKGKPDFPEALYNLGAVRYLLGDRRGAAELALKSLERDPGLRESLTMMAMIRMQEGRLPEARKYAARLLRLDPDRPDALEIMRRIADAESTLEGRSRR